jgi:uncharacterized lipoprotein YddW (UPF0748 family)
MPYARTVRSRLWMCACAAMVVVCAALPASAQQFRGVWVDAFHAGYKSQSQIDNLINHLVASRMNAVIVEVLAYHDDAGGGHGAYWNSSIVPKAKDISPQSFDPLAYLCQKAHQNNIEVHAWIVTYRVCTTWPPSGNSIVAAHPEWLMVPAANQGGGPAKVNGEFVFDPGSPDVQEYLVSIVRELVTNYPIDGINWDYIRYTVTDAGYPASNSYLYSGYERFKRITGCSSTTGACAGQWNDFRRRTIDELVRRVRAEIPWIKTNPRQPLRHTADLIVFGGPPACGSFASTSAYGLFQNWEKWMARGWLDAAIPMNYKREHCATQASQYRAWVDRASCWKHNRHYFSGVATYMNSFANSVTQMQYGAGTLHNGAVLYSYYGTRSNDTLCDDVDNFSNDLSWYTSYLPNNVYTTNVPTPTMPWRNPATATEGTIWGRVKDWDTGTWLDNATVTINGKTEQTDGNGYYVVTMVSASGSGTSHALSVTMPGMNSAGTPAAVVLPGDIVRYDFALGAPAAQMQLSPTVMNRQAELNTNLPSETFTVQNLGNGFRAPLNYVITNSASWMSVSPDRGTSDGEADTITITYNTAGLSSGSYVGFITVTDAAASNSPQVLTVNLTVLDPAKPGDFDRDGDVDQSDFAILQRCLTGRFFGPAGPGCEGTDLNNDLDVEEQDVLLWAQCVSGADVPSDPDCLN